MEEKYCPNYKCKDCKYCGSYPNYCQKRIDHIKVEFAVPWFISCPEQTGVPCNDFEPSSIHVYDLKHYWTNWQSWWNDYLEEWFPYYPKEKPEDKLYWFTINGDRSIRYGVPMMDYIKGNMYNEDKTVLKATKKMYYKQARGGIGYKLIVEDIEGVEI